MQARKKQIYSGKNRRSQDDRRKVDLGPPSGWRERRRAVERRLPELVEDAISHGEWEVQWHAFRTRVAKKEAPPPADKEADGDLHIDRAPVQAQ